MPLVHTVTYGPWGSGKSTFAATFPKPMLVLAFDPLGKEAPYLKRGTAMPEGRGDCDQPVVPVMSKKDDSKLIVQIEYFHDTEVNDDGSYRPVAYRRFLKRFPALYDEIAAGKWATVVFDSLTFMELATRKMHQYDLHKHEKDSRKWFGQATDDLEEAILLRAGGLRCNVVVLAHVDTDKDEMAGSMVFSPSAPGRLRNRLGSGYPEIYVMHARRDKEGGMGYYLQTRADARYGAASVLLEAPDPCQPDYQSILVNYGK